MFLQVRYSAGCKWFATNTISPSLCLHRLTHNAILLGEPSTLGASEGDEVGKVGLPARENQLSSQQGAAQDPGSEGKAQN